MNLKELAKQSMSADWYDALKGEFEKAYFIQLNHFLDLEEKSFTILPSLENIFNAFRITPLFNVKAVILGQDPYPNPAYAHGLSFSVKENVFPFPRSLNHIFKELHEDLNIGIPSSGDLTAWARQGVLLLNSYLTVRAGQPLSHSKAGWEQFTNFAIRTVSEQVDHAAFVLLGGFAQKKRILIDETKHCVIQAAHPSPLSASRGFFGSKIFGKLNTFLSDNGIAEIDFSL